MPPKPIAIKLPSSTGSLGGLHLSGALILRVDRSNSGVLLIDRSEKKPTFREVAATELPRSVTAGVFTADGQHLMLLCTDDSQELPARLVALEVQTGALASGFDLGLARPRELWAHPDGERVYVSDETQTVSLSKRGDVLATFPLLDPDSSSGDSPRFAFNASGTHVLFEVSGGFTVKELGTKKTASFEARSALWLDDDSLLARVRVGDRETGRMELHRIDAATGALVKQLAILPDLPGANVSSCAVNGTHAAFSFLSTRRAGSGAKRTTLHLLQVDLSTGRSSVADIAGRPSGSQVCVGPEATFVAVNMQSVLHVFPH
ncbi:MAG: lactonase family protein [Archangiaceae bacterium]|nr:lactonase family protein [Archangiaceae bacterium]